ncbi:MAG: hypothetical protein AAB536_03670 [Patescibacteria group bacterium]
MEIISQKKVLSAENILLVVFLLLAFLFSFHQIHDPDTFYHIKAGQVIWEKGYVPTSDIFSYTATGNMWVTHEWLAEIIFYLIYANLGIWALIGFSALLACITYLIIIKLAVKKGANTYIALLFGFIVAYGNFGFWLTRPGIFAAFFLVFLIYFLEKYREMPQKLYLFIIPLIVWLWANMHASFVLGLVVLAFYAVALKAQSKFPDYFGRTALGDKWINYLFLISFVSFIVSFLNPNTYKIFLYSAYVQPLSKIFDIIEYRPVFEALNSRTVQIFLAELILLGAFLTWRLGIRKETRDLTTLGLFIGVSLMPFISARHIIFWPFVTIVPLAVGISLTFNETIKKFGHKFLPILLFMFAIPFLAKGVIMFPSEPVNHITLPVDAVNFIKQNNIKGPLFNSYNDGGYLIWGLWPQEKVTIDSRSEVFVGTPVQKYLSVVSLESNWKQIIDSEYKINYFILPYWFQSFITDSSALFSALSNDNFKMIYWDDNSIIMLKDTPKNEDVIEKYGITNVDPFIQPEDVSENINETYDELKKLSERFPDSITIKDYLKRFYLSHNLE